MSVPGLHLSLGERGSSLLHRGRTMDRDLLRRGALNVGIAGLVGAGLSALGLADLARVPDFSDRVRGANAVVVGHVMDVRTALQPNGHGDRVIVSLATIIVEEQL